MKKIIFTIAATLILPVNAQETPEPAAPAKEGIRSIELTVNPFSSKSLEYEELRMEEELRKLRGELNKSNPPTTAGANAGAGYAAPTIDPTELQLLIDRIDYIEQGLEEIRANPPAVFTPQNNNSLSPSNNPAPVVEEKNAPRSYTDNKNYYSSLSQNTDGEFKENYNETVIYKGIVSFGNDKKLSFYDKTNQRGGLAAIGDLVPKPFVTEQAGEERLAKINEIGDNYVIIGYKKIFFNNTNFTNHPQQ